MGTSLSQNYDNLSHKGVEWEEKNLMKFGVCPKCNSQAFSRIEYLCLRVVCNEKHCRDTVYNFIGDEPLLNKVPDDLRHDKFDEWHMDLKKAIIKDELLQL